MVLWLLQPPETAWVFEVVGGTPPELGTLQVKRLEDTRVVVDQAWLMGK